LAFSKSFVVNLFIGIIPGSVKAQIKQKNTTMAKYVEYINKKINLKDLDDIFNITKIMKDIP